MKIYFSGWGFFSVRFEASLKKKKPTPWGFSRETPGVSRENSQGGGIFFQSFWSRLAKIKTPHPGAFRKFLGFTFVYAQEVLAKCPPLFWHLTIPEKKSKKGRIANFHKYIRFLHLFSICWSKSLPLLYAPFFLKKSLTK